MAVAMVKLKKLQGSQPANRQTNITKQHSSNNTKEQTKQHN
jgi:hypothetical protein